MQIDGKLKSKLLQMSQHKSSEKFPPKVRLHSAIAGGGDNADQNVARE